MVLRLTTMPRYGRIKSKHLEKGSYMTQPITDTVTLIDKDDKVSVIGAINTALMSMGFSIKDWLDDDEEVKVSSTDYFDLYAIEVRDDLNVSYTPLSAEGVPALMVISKEKGIGLEIQIQDYTAAILNEIVEELD